MRNHNRHERKRAHQIQRAYRRGCRSSIEAKQELHQQVRAHKNQLCHELLYDDELDFFIADEEHNDWWNYECLFEEGYLLSDPIWRGGRRGIPDIVPTDYRYIPGRILAQYKQGLRNQHQYCYYGNYAYYHIDFEVLLDILQNIYDTKKIVHLESERKRAHKKRFGAFWALPYFSPLPAYTLLREWLKHRRKSDSEDFRHIAKILLKLGYFVFTLDKDLAQPLEERQ